MVGSDDLPPFDRVDVGGHDLEALAGGLDIKERRARYARRLPPHDDLVAGDDQLLDLPFEIWNGFAATLDPGNNTLAGRIDRLTHTTASSDPPPFRGALRR